ncbi:hypothetical protein LO762_10180 [Actinocorallia sp. API 0066]|uniref:hypothetical protein n=1 Tax=Actinocorallia sp. API 0066 TaxID=2896846 RepID=UPI001E4E9BFB|nr:hypothetical protein [Actinocorallia sp. API 0066]MCD0449556.1 hypothetical protein [Actinocorallia sp. API 0066]
MFHRRSLDEEIAHRQAKRGPLAEGRHFEHGPAKFIFVSLISVTMVAHVVALVLLKYT